MDERTQVDFSIKKTEAEWLETLDRFWLAVTPKLFQWLGWVALLAGVSFVQKKTESGWLLFFLTLCSISIAFYFFALFAKIEFKGFLENRPNLQRTISICLSSALAGGIFVLVRISIDVLISANH